jgi:molybdopterin-containing oxidoreductase family membrane subunit
MREILRGSARYYAWLGFLFLVIFLGLTAYSQQATHGHIVANLRDPVPWGLFIGTYAFFVGVAAAAVALVVPGYVYKWKPIKEIVILGEIVAICACVVAILFVMADLGHPERFWHLLPVVGAPNVPSSMVGSNVLILNAYLILNLVLVTYFLYCRFVGHRQSQFFVTVLMFRFRLQSASTPPRRSSSTFCHPDPTGTLRSWFLGSFQQPCVLGQPLC